MDRVFFRHLDPQVGSFRFPLAFLCVDSVFFRHLDSAGSFSPPDSHTPGFRPGSVAFEDRSASAQSGSLCSAAYKQLFLCSGLGTLTPLESVRVPFWLAFLVFSSSIFLIHVRMPASA